MRRRSIVYVLAASLVPVGCGGGGDGGAGAGSTPVTVTLTSLARLDGFLCPDGTGSLTNSLRLGDYATSAGPQGGARGFVSFELTGIPTGATVLSATLTLTQSYVEAAPYAVLGSLLVDHVNYGGALDSGAYARSFPTGQGFGALATDATLGPKSLAVTALVQEDVTVQRERSQFRLRFEFELSADGNHDQAWFWSADNAVLQSQLPTLVVTYRP